MLRHELPAVHEEVRPRVSVGQRLRRPPRAFAAGPLPQPTPRIPLHASVWGWSSPSDLPLTQGSQTLQRAYVPRTAAHIQHHPRRRWQKPPNQLPHPRKLKRATTPPQPPRLVNPLVIRKNLPASRRDLTSSHPARASQCRRRNRSGYSTPPIEGPNARVLLAAACPALKARQTPACPTLPDQLRSAHQPGWPM